MWPRVLFSLVVAALAALFAGIAIVAPAGNISQAAALTSLLLGMVVLLVLFMTAAETLSRLFSRHAPADSEATPPAAPPKPAGAAPRRAA